MAYRGPPVKALGTTRWKRIRRTVRLRDGNQCRECGVSGTQKRLYVHHVTPRAQGGTDDYSNLITLCQPCHMRLEREAQQPAQKPQPAAPWLSGDNQIGGRRPQSCDWGGGCIPNPAAE